MADTGERGGGRVTYTASGVRLVGAAVGGVVSLVLMLAVPDLSQLVRVAGVALVGGFLLAIVASATTRITVDDDEVVIRRLGRELSAPRGELEVRWTPIVAGLGRSGWALGVFNKKTRKGMAMPMTFFPLTTIEALRAHLGALCSAPPAP